MHSYGPVRIDGEAGTIVSSVRRDLIVYANPRSVNPAERKMKAQAIPTSATEKPWGGTTDHVMLNDVFSAMDDDAPRASRAKTHSRLVLESYGRPLKMALTPLEIVQAMENAVAGKHYDHSYRNSSEL